MPTTGTKLYRYQDGAWTAIYADIFTARAAVAHPSTRSTRR